MATMQYKIIKKIICDLIRCIIILMVGYILSSSFRYRLFALDLNCLTFVVVFFLVGIFFPCILLDERRE